MGLPKQMNNELSENMKYIDAFVEAGSDMITVHIETVSAKEIKTIAQSLRPKRVKLGISLNPATPISRIKPVLKFVDFILVMSVNPGFGGQAFIPSAQSKIKQLRAIFKKIGRAHV